MAVWIDSQARGKKKKIKKKQDRNIYRCQGPQDVQADGAFANLKSFVVESELKMSLLLLLTVSSQTTNGMMCRFTLTPPHPPPPYQFFIFYFYISQIWFCDIFWYHKIGFVIYKKNGFLDIKKAI